MSAKATDTVIIRNIYYMMAYAFRSLDTGEYKKVGSEAFETLEDLLAAILSIGVDSQRRRGFEKDYHSTSESLRTIRGKLEIAQTAKLHIAGKMRAQCTFDEFDENTYKNQILKKCIGLLLENPNVAPEQKKSLKRSYFALGSVDDLTVNTIDWSRLRYHRNNGSYKLLMNVCWMIINRQLPSFDNPNYDFTNFTSTRELSALYEKFIFEYIKYHHPELKVSAKEITNGIGENSPSFLPKLCSDVTIEYENRTLIIDAKCYGQILKANFGHEMLSPNNRNQILSYVLHEAYDRPEINVQGMLLYALTESESAMSGTWSELGHTFHCYTLDLNCDFSEIAEQLESIVDLVKGV